MVSWLCQQVSHSQSVRQTRSWRALGIRKITTRAHEGKVREGCVGANHESTGLCLYIPRSTTLNLRPPGTRYPVVDVGWWSLGEDVRIRMGERMPTGPPNTYCSFARYADLSPSTCWSSLINVAAD